MGRGGIVLLIMLRTTRGYFGVLLGIALVILPTLEAVRNEGSLRRALARDGLRLASIVLMVILSETVLAALWFPLGPLSLASEVVIVQTSVAAVHGFKGRAEVLIERGKAAEGEPVIERGKAVEGERSHSRTLEIVRRVFGPYIWTPPTHGFRSALVAGDLPAYLSVLLWYWAVPFGVLGLAALVRQRRWEAWLVVMMCLLFGLTLLLFNVSHRQRDSVFLPFLLISATACWKGSSRRTRSRMLWATGVVVGTLGAVYWVLRISYGSGSL